MRIGRPASAGRSGLSACKAVFANRFRTEFNAEARPVRYESPGRPLFAADVPAADQASRTTRLPPCSVAPPPGEDHAPGKSAERCVEDETPPVRPPVATRSLHRPVASPAVRWKCCASLPAAGRMRRRTRARQRRAEFPFSSPDPCSSRDRPWETALPASRSGSPPAFA